MLRTNVCLVTSFCISLVLTPALALAAPPEVMTIVEQMKDVFESEQPRMSEVAITVSGDDEQSMTWTGRQVRKVFPDGKRTLLLLQTPDYLKGTALLIAEREEQGKAERDAMWMYLPAVNRVRKIVPVETYQRFFDSDFTYADLGFVSRRGQHRLLGEEEHLGKRAYKVEFVPQDSWYYSRIITWVEADSMLPLQRDYYDVAGERWKRLLFKQVMVINDIPTPLVMEMRDLQQETQTTFRLNQVSYDEDIPDILFDPDHLRTAMSVPH